MQQNMIIIAYNTVLMEQITKLLTSKSNGMVTISPSWQHYKCN